MAIDARLLAYQQGGTATYIRGLLQGFRQVAGANDEVVVLVSRRDHQSRLMGPFRHYVVWTPCHHRFERWTLGAELRRLSVDVVHSPDFIPPARLGAAWARVVTVHDLAFLRFPELLTAESRRYYGQVYRAVREADRIIAVSEATRRDILELTGARAEKIAVIAEGVDPILRTLPPDGSARRLVERFGLDRPYFLFVGTLEPRKNLMRLITAFGLFRQRTGPHGPLLALAGQRGWLVDDLDQAAAQLGDAVRFLGGVTREDLVALYDRAIALVLVSLYEGFGLPALEAMARGCPVVGANVAALPEVIGDAGLLVEPTDVEGIAQALACLWDDPTLRRELGARGRCRSSRFDWLTAARQTLAVYRQAMACGS
ncbi:MAG TPA: glycosyltransferase family 1 protein [Chloroflexota bacterium]|nr:glycosyltransferase family 1 protein [Chloroflexota bacterium]